MTTAELATLASIDLDTASRVSGKPRAYLMGLLDARDGGDWAYAEAMDGKRPSRREREDYHAGLADGADLDAEASDAA